MTTKARQLWIVAPGKIEWREVTLKDPGPDEVQLKMIANGICMFEVSVFKGTEPMYPTFAGHEGISVVVKAGKNVKNLKEGDYVPAGNWTDLQNMNSFGLVSFSKRFADWSTIICEPVECIVRALYSYEISPGDRVLMTGAGYMGLLNVQGLAHCPLAELVVADINPRKLKLAKAFGATETIQVGTPAGDARMEELKGNPFDLVIEASGALPPLQKAGLLTRRGGRLSVFSWHHGPREVDFGVWHMRGLKVLNSAPLIAIDHNVQHNLRAVRLIEKGTFDQTKLITHRHKFEDVQKALEAGAARKDDYVKGVLLF